MTAFFTLLTPDGFILAADGRVTRSEDHSIKSDSEQKLFCLQDQVGTFGCGLAGTVVLTPDHSDEVLIDLRIEVAKIASVLRERRCEDLGGYAVRLGRALNHVLAAAKSSGELERFPEGGTLHEGETGATIARVYLNGYYREKPSYAHLRIFHTDQNLNAPKVKSNVVTLGFNHAHGSSVVAEKVFRSDDPAFGRYRVTEIKNLDDAIRKAQLFIEAHSDPRLLALDEKHCRGVGGNVHIALLNATAGFVWVAGWEPSPSLDQTS